MHWSVYFLIVLAVFALPIMCGGYLARKFRMPDHGWKIGLVLFSLLASITIIAIGGKPKLGIDLSGGVILIYEVDQEQRKSDAPVEMDKLIDAVTRRINPGGVREVTIRPYGVNQVEIIVPEADQSEMQRMKKVLTSVGLLEFRILANTRDHPALIKRAELENTKIILGTNAEGKQVELGRWIPIEKGQEASFNYPEVAQRMRKVGQREVTEILVVKDDFNVTGGYLTQTRPSEDSRGRPCVNFMFDSVGAQLFGGLTSTNLPDETQEFTRKLGIILDGFLYSAPSIQSTIYDRGEITGSFTKQEVQDLVNVLNAGSLPAALSREPISELLTGPTLGRDTIIRGSWSMVLSTLLVLVFMIVYYRFSGVIACLALVLNVLLIVAVMISIQAAFTLPGLAGLVLGIGMAVDANVLIYERMREELARGTALRMAIRNGFDRATTTIVDSNLTTLISATVLYIIGTDQIKGFAVTLWLGVVLNMFTAIFCSRVLFDIAEKRRWITELKMMQFFRAPNIDFLGWQRPAIAGSLLVIAIGMVAVVMRGGGLLDIDFTGGVSVQVVFDPPIGSTQEVRDKLADLPDLAVSDVQIGNEPRLKRFVVNTSEADTRKVETAIKKVFGGKLATNSLTVTELTEISPRQGAAPAGVSAPPSPPTAGKQTRNDLPDDSVLAVADVPSLLLAQADPAAEKPAEPAAEKSAETVAEKPVEPAEKPAVETPSAQGTPSSAVAAPPIEKPAAEPAEKTPAKKTPAAAGAESKPAGTVPALVDPFAGGSSAQLKFAEKVNHDSVREMFDQYFGSDAAAPQTEFSNPDYREADSTPYNVWYVKTVMSPGRAKEVFVAIGATLADTPYFPSSNTIGGKVAGKTRTLAIAALAASLIGIIVYLWVRFQKVAYGLAPVIAVVHDVLVTLGAMALSLYLAEIPGVQSFLMIDPFKIGLTAVAAFLTIIGYSVNDTVVIFDRIREVRGKSPRLTREMVNRSVNQTLSRTVLTSGTVLIVVIVLYIFGGQPIHGFAFAMLIGLIAGSYSTIFIASALLVWMDRPGKVKQSSNR